MDELPGAELELAFGETDDLGVIEEQGLQMCVGGRFEAALMLVIAAGRAEAIEETELSVVDEDGAVGMEREDEDEAVVEAGFLLRGLDLLGAVDEFSLLLGMKRQARYKCSFAILICQSKWI